MTMTSKPTTSDIREILWDCFYDIEPETDPNERNKIITERTEQITALFKSHLTTIIEDSEWVWTAKNGKDEMFHAVDVDKIKEYRSSL